MSEPVNAILATFDDLLSCLQRLEHKFRKTSLNGETIMKYVPRDPWEDLEGFCGMVALWYRGEFHS